MIGILPAGGRSVRMQGIPKFLLPVPDGYLLDVLCRRMLLSRLIIGANFENTTLLRNSAHSGANVLMLETATVCECVRRCGQYYEADGLEYADNSVLFGMPDTYWTATNVYQCLSDELIRGTDVAIAVWHIRDDQRGKLGQCEIDSAGRVLDIIDKDTACPLEYAWGALAWRPPFWRYIRNEDAHMGIPLNRAINAGLTVKAVIVEGEYYDCGTPDEYFRCIREVTEVSHATI